MIFKNSHISFSLSRNKIKIFYIFNFKKNNNKEFRLSLDFKPCSVIFEKIINAALTPFSDFNT
jgi:hypothetical protein